MKIAWECTQCGTVYDQAVTRCPKCGCIFARVNGVEATAALEYPEIRYGEITKILADKSVRILTKVILIKALTLDPVDALADIELARDTWAAAVKDILEGGSDATAKDSQNIP